MPDEDRRTPKVSISTRCARTSPSTSRRAGTQPLHRRADRRRSLEPHLLDLRRRRTTWVLRRPPLGHVLPTAHDMAREYRVHRPRSRGPACPCRARYALCEDLDVNDAPFYVMEKVDGVIYRDGAALAALDADEARRVLRGARRRARRDPRRRLRRGRARRLRASRRLPRAPGAPLGPAVGALEDPRAARGRRARPPAATPRSPSRVRRRSCTATTGSTTR